jgi:hypothetical protein
VVRRIFSVKAVFERFPNEMRKKVMKISLQRVFQAVYYPAAMIPLCPPNSSVGKLIFSSGNLRRLVLL